jgi:replication factor A1
MEIKDLHARQGDVELVAEVVDKAPPRTFEKFGKQGRVCNAKIKDASGTVTLTLWNEDIDKINVGDKIKIVKGYVGEWQGELQLSAGKFGSIEIVEKGTGKPSPQPAPATSSDQQEEKDNLSDTEDDFKEPDVEEEYF